MLRPGMRAGKALSSPRRSETSAPAGKIRPIPAFTAQ